LEPADRQREVFANARIAVLELVERLDEREGERLVAADLRILHQLRKLKGGRPLARHAAGPNLGQVILSRSSIGDERAKAHIHEHRDANNGERDQKELNSEGGRGDQWLARRGYALGKFFHVSGVR